MAIVGDFLLCHSNKFVGGVCVCVPVFLKMLGRFVDTFGNWCLDLLFVKNLGRIYSSMLSRSIVSESL